MTTHPELLELARLVVERFAARKASLVTAESCTGGMISAKITEIPGASEVFGCGFVTYSNAAKSRLLGVEPKILSVHGAVSPQTAIAMASGGLSASGASACVAVTGIAGPGGGSAKKPVGLVYVAIAAEQIENVNVKEIRFGDIGRSKIRRKTVAVALKMLLAIGLEQDGE